MQIINNPNKIDWLEILKRPTQTVNDIEGTVTSVFQDVVNRGDAAIKEYTARFDGVDLESNIVSPEEIEAAVKTVAEPLKNAIKKAKQNIEVFHRAQQTSKVEVETTNGVSCWQEKRPIEK
ncbi:histidinol dehydrogenase [Algibacter lectus]|uniref:Histidinol dehydrogenase n=1 Tax=Algibacter lectus TaxID=221126 RepID=A0A090WQM5_9FLAO|nr:histidinol dehydrogenase [Algibacter lectus]